MKLHAAITPLRRRDEVHRLGEDGALHSGFSTRSTGG
jgi:hypothetical protein